MRITVNLDDDVLQAVRSLALERRESLGSVMSVLIRRALSQLEAIVYSGDLPVFSVREDAPPITPEMVASALIP